MPESRSNAERTTGDAHRRDRLIRQVIKARRSVDAGLRSESAATGDPAKAPLVRRAKQWVEGEPPRGAIPGAS